MGGDEVHQLLDINITNIGSSQFETDMLIGNFLGLRQLASTQV